MYRMTTELIDRIDWENIMPMERYAFGHDAQMKGLLKNVTVLAHYNEGDYQGAVATCVKLNDTNEIIIYQDLYGSCSGCDAWDGASDEEVQKLCIDLAKGAYIFKNLEDCKTFLRTPDEERSYDWFGWGNPAKHLLKHIENGIID